MRTFTAIALLLVCAGFARGAPIIPTEEGTTWRYHVKDEAGAGSPLESQLDHRIAGKQQFGGREVLKLETVVDTRVTRTQLLTVDQNGIRAFAYGNKEGPMVGFIDPQLIVPAKLKKDAKWECIDEIADVRVHEHFTVAGIDKTRVPAGEFEAYRIHCEELTPMSITIDRWFVRGVGVIKEISTLRSPTGDLIRRRTLELTRPPGLVQKPPEIIKQLSVSVSSEPIGGASEKEFPSTTENIYARWEGHLLRDGARVRAVWVAENVGDVAPPNYKIDEASAIVTSTREHGMFTLSRPDGGWAPGTYRVEFYLDDGLVDTVKLTIK